MTVHAVLGASSTSRWMNCPGSVRLSEGLPSTSSPQAKLGSAAHSLAEVCLLSGDLPMEYLGGQHPDPEYEDILIDVDMVDAVSVYVDHLRKYKVPLDKTTVEVRLDLSLLGEWARGLFGTGDFVSRYRSVLLVEDYKHGEGVLVEVSDNTQLKYYAVGALLQLEDPHVVKQVRSTVVQPRMHHDSGRIRRQLYGVQELLDWANGELKEAVLATKDPDAPLIPSDKACMFCPAKGICPSIADKSMAEALLDFDETGALLPVTSKDQLTPSQIAAILDAEKNVMKWFRSVAEMAHHNLSNGNDTTDGRYKLVAGRSSRSWKNDSTAQETLLGLEYGHDDLFTEKFISPAQAEKLVGKQQVKLLSGLISTAQGKPTLAPVDDKRPAILSGPEDDFT